MPGQRFLVAFAFIASVSFAQSPLTTTFANNNGGAVGGAVYFDVMCVEPTGIAITSLDLNIGGTGGLAGSIDVYLANPGTVSNSIAGWQLVTNGTVASSNPAGVATPVALAAPISMAFGCSRRVAIVHHGLAAAYTTAVGLPDSYANDELVMYVGEATNVPFTGTPFTPRLTNASIHYTVGVPGANCADFGQVTSIGSGCGGSFASFYEGMAPPVMDLSGRQLVGTFTGAGYIVTNQAGSIAPVGSVDPAAVPLTLGDDDSVAVGSFGIEVFSNCQVAFGPGNSTGFVPTVAALLGNPSTALYSWTDLQPNAAGSGLVTYEESGSTVHVTYDGVYAWGTTDPCTVQFRIDMASMDWVISWGALAATGPENYLVGYSPGGLNADPGPIDLSATTSFQTVGSDIPAMQLSSLAVPMQGSPFVVNVDNLPATTLLHAGLMGLSSPGLPLSILGMPNECVLHASLESITVAPVAGSSHVWTPVNVPVLPGLNGFQFYVQSAALTGTFPESRVSNGLACEVGSFTGGNLQVTSMSPTSASYGATLTLNGSGFGTDPGAYVLELGDGWGTVTNATPTQLTATFDGSASTAVGPSFLYVGNRSEWGDETFNAGGGAQLCSGSTTYDGTKIPTPIPDLTPVQPTEPPNTTRGGGVGQATVPVPATLGSPTIVTIAMNVGGNIFIIKLPIFGLDTLTAAQAGLAIAHFINVVAANAGFPISAISPAGSGLVTVAGLPGVPIAIIIGPQ